MVWESIIGMARIVLRYLETQVRQQYIAKTIREELNMLDNT